MTIIMQDNVIMIEQLLNNETIFYYSKETYMILTLTDDNRVNVYFEVDGPLDIDYAMSIIDHDIDINNDNYKVIKDKINTIATKINTGEIKL